MKNKVIERSAKWVCPYYINTTGVIYNEVENIFIYDKNGVIFQNKNGWFENGFWGGNACFDILSFEIGTADPTQSVKTQF